MTDNLTKIRDEIIATALPDVAFDGWTPALLRAAAVRAGHSADTVKAVFPGGLPDAVAHFSSWADRQMLVRLQDIDIAPLRIRDRVRTGVITRLEILNPHKEAVRKALAYWAVPPRNVRAGRVVWQTADRIWDWAGDTATDYNRYTKRGLLSAVISSTTLAWLNDDSADMEATRSFLDRRIENVMQVGRLLGKVKKAS